MSIMQEKQQEYNISYFNQTYIKAVGGFEKTILWLDSKLPTINTGSYRGSNKILHVRKLKQIQPGINSQTKCEGIVMRRVYTPSTTFFLIVQTLGSTNPQEFACVVIPTISKLCETIRPGMSLTLKQPNLATQLGRHIRVLIVFKENAVYKGVPFQQQSKGTKQMGNELYKSGQYLDALLTYQSALLDHYNFSQFRERAILYSNSSACLIEIYLYETGLEYANIAIRIDNQYPKSYFRKITCLLQLSRFEQIPKILINLYHKIGGFDMIALNMKYSNFIQNSKGGFDWVHIFSKPGNKARQFSQFRSPKLALKQIKGYPYYIATEDIAEKELLLVCKPTIYFRTCDKFKEDFQKLTNQISIYTSLQQSFQSLVRSMPCACHSKWPIKPTAQLNKMEIYKKMERSLFLERQFERMTEEAGYGVWKDMLRFQQQCQPNCSFVHLKSAFVVTACRPIKEDQMLSVDFFAESDLQKRSVLMKNRLGVTCNCNLCKRSRTLTKTAMDLNECIKVIDAFPAPKIMKQMLWKMLATEKKPSPYQPLLMKKYLILMRAECTWQDIINVMGALRYEQELELKTRMDAYLVGYLSKFLKISHDQTDILLAAVK